jgi:flagellar FliL protein
MARPEIQQEDHPDLKVVEGGGEAQGPEETPAAPRRPRFALPKPPAVLVKVSLLVVVVAAMAAGSYVVITRLLAPHLGPPAEERAANAAAPEPPGPVYTLPELIVNPAGTSGRRYLKVGIAFETDGLPAIEEMTQRDPQIRDLIIRELTSRTLEELVDPVLREEVRETVILKINEVLAAGAVRNLYFTDYIIQ